MEKSSAFKNGSASCLATNAIFILASFFSGSLIATSYAQSSLEAVHVREAQLPLTIGADLSKPAYWLRLQIESTCSIFSQRDAFRAFVEEPGKRDVPVEIELMTIRVRVGAVMDSFSCSASKAGCGKEYKTKTQDIGCRPACLAIDVKHGEQHWQGREYCLSQ